MTFTIPHHSADNSAEHVARNPNAPADLLEKLAEDESLYVRAAVARNPNAPVYLLEKLADDESWEVRCHVAESQCTPVALLEELAEDKAPAVRSAVIKQAKELTDTALAVYITAIAKSYD